MTAESFSVTFVRSAAQIDPVFWESCFGPQVEGRWWYQALEDAGLDEQFSFLYGVIHSDGIPVGIAPAFLMDFPASRVAPPGLLLVVRWLGRIFPSLVYPKTLFVGSPCADEGVIGLLDGVDRRSALLALHRALKAQARAVAAALLIWKDFPESDAADLERIAEREPLFRLISFPGTVVEFSSPDKNRYFAALKGSRRHILRKKLRRSKANVELRVEIVQAPDRQVLDELFGLFRQTYEKATTRFEKLNRRFFAILAAQPLAYFIVLKEETSNAMVAFMLCFKLGPKIINKFIGIDYRKPREWLLYFRLWDAAVDWALSRGAMSIQSGQTGYAPKIETGHRLVPLFNYCAHRNQVIHSLAGAFASRIDWSTLDDDLARHIRAHPEAISPAPRFDAQSSK